MAGKVPRGSDQDPEASVAEGPVSGNMGYATGTFMQRLRHSAECRRGTAVMEFALIAPVAVLSIIGLLELSMIMFVQSLMEGGLREASRFGITGYIPPGMTREERILEIVASNTIGLVDMETVEVITKVYPSFSDVNQPEPFTDQNANGSYDAGEPFTDSNGNGQWDSDMGTAGIGGPGDIVRYTLTYDWPLLTPVLSSIIGTGGKIKLSATAAVRNEPFTLPVE
jgi:Flp pilus assembly protein TadG